jgi:hypothetical protein
MAAAIRTLQFIIAGMGWGADVSGDVLIYLTSVAENKDLHFQTIVCNNIGDEYRRDRNRNKETSG